MNSKKNKKIVLATPPQSYSIEEYNSLPLGLAYIASCLEKEGYEVTIIDCYLNNFNLDKAAKVIVNKNPNAVGFTASSANRFNVIELSKKIKRLSPNTIIFVGGQHFSVTAEDALRNIPSIDFVVIGEGEITSVELLNRYFSKASYHDLKGICFRNNENQIIKTEKRPPIENLDSLPMPAYHLLELKKYSPLPYYFSNLTKEEKKMPAIGVISSRGCPFNCIFCANNLEEIKAALQVRDPKNFVDEIQYLYDQYGFKMFNFWNDTFTFSKQYVFDVCNEIMRRALKVKWYARGRVDTVDKEMLKKMKEAGCISIMYGAESGSDRILRILKKGITVQQIKKAVRDSAEVEMDVLVSFMISSPEETREDVKKTLDLVKELRSYSNKIFEMDLFPTLIYPGTIIERISLKEGKVFPKNFSWNRKYEFRKNRQLLLPPSVPVYTQEFTLEEIMAFRLKNKYQQSLKQPKIKIISKSIRFLTSIRNFSDLKMLFLIIFNSLKSKGRR